MRATALVTGVATVAVRVGVAPAVVATTSASSSDTWPAPVPAKEWRVVAPGGAVHPVVVADLSAQYDSTHAPRGAVANGVV